MASIFSVVLIFFAAVHPNITTSPQNTTVVSPSDISLNCEAIGFPIQSLLWQHDGQDISSNDQKRNVQTNQIMSEIKVVSSLLIRGSEFKDRGMYRCLVSNLVGHDEASSVVTVQCMISLCLSRNLNTQCVIKYLHFLDIPSIIISPIVKDVIKPNAVSLQCTAVGFPRPSIEWVKDNDPILPNTYRVDEATGVNNIVVPTLSSNLTVTPTVTLDTGNFVCVAKNILQSVSSRPVQLTVLGKYYKLAHYFASNCTI